MPSKDFVYVHLWLFYDNGHFKCRGASRLGIRKNVHFNIFFSTINAISPGMPNKCGTARLYEGMAQRTIYRIVIADLGLKLI